MHSLISLRAVSGDLLEALITSDRHATIRTGLDIEPGYQTNPDLLLLMRACLRGHRPPQPWGLSAIIADRRHLVGLGGFLGPPDADGMVDVTFGIAPACRNRGYATAALGLLVQAAESTPATVIRAHSGVTDLAATCVLTRMGFSAADEVPYGMRRCWLRPMRLTAPLPPIVINHLETQP